MNEAKMYSTNYNAFITFDLNKRYIREPNTNVALKYLHSSQNSIEILTNEVKKQLTSIFGRQITKIYGISQNPDTSDYILYQHYTRDSSIEVSLRCLHNSENSIDFLINEAKKYLPKKGVLFGISQNPDTNDYILVQNNFMNLANFISGNEKIDDFIQEMNNHKDVVFEWIPYDQFDEIEEIDNDGLTVYYAIWKNGPLCYVGWNFDRYTRDSSKMVKKYSTYDMYGISQNPDTNNYILVLVWTRINKNKIEYAEDWW
ncbi:kinase-like domain-containing protein [Rhizophagus irregularis DAOM 181602=DAOM 197198]|nr:kinase-like domain-containing protein [Rhizophagus irregularis DAOM 181602=DAOM 197198]